MQVDRDIVIHELGHTAVALKFFPPPAWIRYDHADGSYLAECPVPMLNHEGLELAAGLLSGAWAEALMNPAGACAYCCGPDLELVDILLKMDALDVQAIERARDLALPVIRDFLKKLDLDQLAYDFRFLKVGKVLVFHDLEGTYTIESECPEILPIDPLRIPCLK